MYGGLRICMTFDNMGKTVSGEKDCNFLESQALAFIKYSLARVTILFSFDTWTKTRKDWSHRTKQ